MTPEAKNTKTAKKILLEKYKNFISNRNAITKFKVLDESHKKRI